MNARVTRNRQLLTDLFAGPFRGHAIIMDAQMPVKDPAEGLGLGDYAVSSRPVADWVPHHLRQYEAMLTWHEALEDDSVPYARPWTGTGLFAAAFGCPIHFYDDDMPACALPLVSTPQEADALPEPDLNAPTLARVFEMGHLLRERLGPDVPISVPDIQSPFDIAALIWKKEEFFVALLEAPETVKGLVDKCHHLLKRFLAEFLRQFPNANLCHCPTAWAPPELGCWLSEDEAGSLSIEMFEEFCLPSLVELSETFGGLFVHCCATADHQYGSFTKIPRLRGMNRVFQHPGPRPAITAFSGTTVLLVSWLEEQAMYDMLAMAQPDTRFLFNPSARPLDEAKALYARLRARCPRRDVG